MSDICREKCNVIEGILHGEPTDPNVNRKCAYDTAAVDVLKEAEFQEMINRVADCVLDGASCVASYCNPATITTWESIQPGPACEDQCDGLDGTYDATTFGCVVMTESPDCPVGESIQEVEVETCDPITAICTTVTEEQCKPIP